MRKLLLLLTLILLSSQLFSSFAFANSNINTTKSITYRIDQSGDIETNYILNLKNNSKEKVVITSYRFPIPFKDITNDSLTIDSNRYLFNKSKTNTGTDISIVLNSIVINRNESINIVYTFKLPKYINITNEIKNITLPAKTTDIDQVNIDIIYPEYWKLPLKVSSAYTSTTKDRSHVINIPNVKDNYIEISLGNSLIYEYKIKKKFINDQNISNIYTVNLPISINNQYVYLENISPLPDNIDIDDSNNITLQYILDKKSEITVEIQAYIELNQTNTNLDNENPVYITQTGYWLLSNDTEKNRLYRYLKDNGISETKVENIPNEQLDTFYRSVYTYIIDRLEPQTSTLLQNYSSRRGIENILQDRGNSSLDDYIDFTTATYRLLNIPTRVSVGYVAKTDNKSGYYHTWLEYFNEKTNNWNKIDPYTEDLTKKSLFNQNLDDRVSIVIKDINPIAPQIQYLNTEEITVSQYNGTISSFGQLDINIEELIFSKTEKYIPIYINVKNNTNRLVIIDNIEILNNEINISNTNLIEKTILLPNQSERIIYTVELKDIIDFENLKSKINYIDNNKQQDSIVKNISIKKHYNTFELALISIIISGIISGILYLVFKRKFN